jgi:hypothetical protein
VGVIPVPLHFDPKSRFIQGKLLRHKKICVVCAFEPCIVREFPDDLVYRPSALLTRVKSVQGDVDKLTSNNATLQMYIDNLTMQMAKRR